MSSPVSTATTPTDPPTATTTTPTDPPTATPLPIDSLAVFPLIQRCLVCALVQTYFLVFPDPVELSLWFVYEPHYQIQQVQIRLQEATETQTFVISRYSGCVLFYYELLQKIHKTLTPVEPSLYSMSTSSFVDVSQEGFRGLVSWLAGREVPVVLSSDVVTHCAETLLQSHVPQETQRLALLCLFYSHPYSLRYLTTNILYRLRTQTRHITHPHTSWLLPFLWQRI
jgi:hypothetical protein